MKRGKIFFISGPSGVGKGTVIDYLRQHFTDWVFPPSCTTRSPRPGEKEGVTYFYISEENFREKITAGEFLEYAQVHGGYFYGTLREPLLFPIDKGKTVIREFDVQGFSQARERLDREDYYSIFLEPESENDLIQNIKKRGNMPKEELERRLKSYRLEIMKQSLYDCSIVSRSGKVDALIRSVIDIIQKHA